MLNFDNSNKITAKNQRMVQMLQYQKKNLSYKIKLEFDDIKRIVNNIDTSIFDENECCIWKGYITNNNDKCKYVNFYFKHHKIALHRILYINYVEQLDENQYLKFTCPNKGICCNINHIEKCNKIIDPTKFNPFCKPLSNDNNGLRVIKLSENTSNSEKRKLIVVFD